MENVLNFVAYQIIHGSVEVYYQGYDGAKKTGIDSEGKEYSRKFTKTYRLTTSFDSGSNNGFNVAAEIKVDYTKEKKTENDKD